MPIWPGDYNELESFRPPFVTPTLPVPPPEVDNQLTVGGEPIEVGGVPIEVVE